jgi:hypothetical protein
VLRLVRKPVDEQAGVDAIQVEPEVVVVELTEVRVAVENRQEDLDLLDVRENTRIDEEPGLYGIDDSESAGAGSRSGTPNPLPLREPGARQYQPQRRRGHDQHALLIRPSPLSASATQP